MAALAATVFSEYPTDKSATRYSERNSDVVKKQFKISSASAGDTATAAVMLFGKILEVSSVWNATTSAVATAAVDPVNNLIQIGTGPSAAELYLTVTGTPKL
jgi:hypothetical protein